MKGEHISMGVSVIGGLVAVVALVLSQFNTGVNLYERLARMEAKQEYLIQTLEDIKRADRNYRPEFERKPAS